MSDVLERDHLREAWAEYLAWTQGSAPEQYEETEALAWGRLQIALSPDPRHQTFDFPASPNGKDLHG